MFYQDLIYATFITLGCHCVVLFAGEVPRPRGVAISRAALYQPRDEHFTCFDGIKTIKFLQVNDDFCDCSDGSDEPGTSACPNGLFHCTNAGHRPINIPSSRVNDGICDCCDASDEYQMTDQSQCLNTCMELGREERQLRKSQEELFKNGAALLSELSVKGKQLKSERIERLAELEKRRNEADAIQIEKEAIKKEAEAIESEALEVYKQAAKEAAADVEFHDKIDDPGSNHKEAEETFRKYDVNADGFIDISELQVDRTFDKDRDGVVSVEEAKFFLDEQERIDLEGFVSLSWSRVKPYLMLASGIFKAPAVGTDEIEDQQQEQQQQQQENPNDQVVHNQRAEEFDGEEEEEEEEAYEDEEEDVGEGSITEETTNTAVKPEYDPETQRIVENANTARNAFGEAERLVREIDQEIKEIQEQNAKDYGPQEEFAPLDGECFTFEDREYVYKLCPFDRASQQQRSGGAETTLGRWDHWTDEHPNKYFQMKYSNGASCWNGPQRSALVQLKCALEHKITSVSEPNRCEYFFVFETPAACGDHFEEAIAGERNDNHDEL